MQGREQPSWGGINDLDHEKLQVLAGTRGGRRENLRRAAVRIEDLAGLLELPLTFKSTKAAGAAPTAAEYDALVTEVRAMHQRLSVVVAALQARLLP